MSGTFDNTSPLFQVRHWRNVPEAEEAALEDFLAWLEYDDQAPTISKDELKDVKALVDAYLSRHPKVEQGERELLRRWIQAVQEA